jgi:hypothetical protein
MLLPSVADALIVIILLIPGFIAFGIVKRIGNFGRPLSEFETTVWSFVFSAIIIFFFIYITKLDDLDKIREQFFSPDKFSIIFVLAVLIGIIAGLILWAFRRNHTRQGSWEFAMDKYFKFYHNNSNKKEKLIVNIITKDNHEYSGIIDHVTEDTGGDILLNGPCVVDRNGKDAKEFLIGEALF